MPRIQSSIKDVRRTKSRRIANRTAKSQVKTAIRRVRTVPLAERKQSLLAAIKTIDKAVSNKRLPKNAGARYKSRLTRLVNSASSQAS
jgi:small subunit ribosomal protein S20